jgi:transcriptional regulator with XRE-family HTH domain
MRKRLRQLLANLRNRATRALFVETQIETIIPFQVRALRLRKGWTQKQLAKHAGMGQGQISILESHNHEGAVNVKTLVKLAAAFDVGLIVRFAPFSEIVDWSTRLNAANHFVPDFEMEWKTASEQPQRLPVQEKSVHPTANVIESMARVFGTRTGIEDDLRDVA